jgi:uncharacterized protein with FMN-binding domain
MTKPKQTPQTLVFSTQTLKKLLLSSVVVFTFIAYTVRERLNGADTTTAASAVPTADTQSKSSLQNTASNGSSTSSISNVSNNTFRDGQFTGNVTDAYWGNVEVQAVIQSGKITDVQFLDYPHDRRTSAFINSQAMPWLTSEAVQAQSARVNIISGATLTSEAFIQSLQSALDKARNL